MIIIPQFSAARQRVTLTRAQKREARACSDVSRVCPLSFNCESLAFQK